MNKVKSGRSLYTIYFAFLIMYRIILSTFVEHGSLLNHFFYFLVGVAFCMWIALFITKSHNLNEYLFITLSLAFAGLCLYVGQVNIFILMVLTMYAEYLSVSELLRAFWFGTFLGFFMVVLASFVGILPIKDINDTFVFGFENPNTPGLYIATLVSINMVFKWYSMKIWDCFATGVSLFVIIVLLKDYTAAMMLFIFLIFYIFKKTTKKVIKHGAMKIVLFLCPFMLLLSTYYLANNFGKYNFISKLNEIITSRPSIWNYYLQNYPISLWGNDVQKNYIFSIYRVGNGAFDGLYLYLPMTAGIIISVIIFFLVERGLWSIVRTERVELITFCLIYILMAFSENMFIMYYQSPAILLLILSCNKMWISQYSLINQHKG